MERNSSFAPPLVVPGKRQRGQKARRLKTAASSRVPHRRTTKRITAPTASAVKKRLSRERRASQQAAESERDPFLIFFLISFVEVGASGARVVQKKEMEKRLVLRDNYCTRSTSKTKNKQK